MIEVKSVEFNQICWLVVKSPMLMDIHQFFVLFLMNWKPGHIELEWFINTCMYLRCGILGSSEFQRLIEKPTLEVSGTGAQRGALVWVSWNIINIFVSIQYFWYPKIRKAIHPPHLRRGVRSDAQLSCTETWFQKCSQSGGWMDVLAGIVWPRL